MVQDQSKKLQECCPDVVNKIQGKLGSDIQHECGMSFSSMMSRYSQTLPSDSNLDNDSAVIDQTAKNALQVMNVINWWAMPCPNLYPLHSPDNKNVARLCTAASLSMWGVNDCILADTMRKILTGDEKNGQKLFKRWVAVNNFESQTDQVKSAGWKSIIQAVGNEDLPLSPFHVFLLANILRRTIIIIGKSAISGVYLPLFWPESSVIKSPLVLGEKSDIIPLIPNQPEPGRDFVPIENISGERLPVNALVSGEKVQADDLLNSYLEIQQQPVLVNHQLNTLKLAKLKVLEMSYDMCIIEQYLDGISGINVDMESYIVCDRWAQLAMGFPPMDWFLPKQVSLYSFNNSSSEQMDYDTPEEAPTAAIAPSSKGNFFKRQTVESNETDKKEEPKKPDIKAKRAMFKRTATLSDMGPGFGGRRGAVVIGKTEEPSATAPPRKMGPTAGRPGLGTRVRSRKKIIDPAPITEEEDESINPFEQKLKQTYKVPDNAPAPQGFVADRSILRSKDKIVERQGSLSELVPPC